MIINKVFFQTEYFIYNVIILNKVLHEYKINALKLNNLLTDFDFVKKTFF